MQIIKPVSEIHNSSTHSLTNKLLKVPKIWVKTTERGIRYFGVVVWSMIPLEVRQCKTLKEFKTELQAELFLKPP